MATASTNDIELEQQSDETYELLCSLCTRKNRTTEAVKYCADCNDYYCTRCVQFHEEIPALSGHKILDKGQAKAKDLPVAPTERCERHRFKTVDMYCQNHDEVGCYTCMNVDHRMCKDIFDIPEHVQNIETSLLTKQFQEQLQKAGDKLKVLIKVRGIEKESLLKGKEEALQSLHDVRREIDEILDELEQKSASAIEDIYHTLIQQLEHKISTFKECQTEVQSAEASFVSSGSNKSQRFVGSKKGKRATEKALKMCEGDSTQMSPPDIKVRREGKLFVCLESINGIVRLPDTNVMYSILRKTQYKIRHQSDNKSCTISCAVVLKDGSTILADENNKKLKHVDSEFNIVDVCNLQEEPWQMCSVSEKEVAVIANGEFVVTFVSVGEEMKKTKEFKTDHSCYGIACANDNIYVTNPHTSVIIYDMSGTKLKKISKDQNRQRLFSSLYGISVSDNGLQIYVADNTIGLVVLNKYGSLQGKYDCSELVGARRVCVTDNGTVFVSGENNSCILQFTPDGKKLGDVMASDNGKEKCAAICFDNQRSKLVVGRPDKDKVDVYDVL